MKIVFFDIDGTLINAQEGMMQPRHQTKPVSYTHLPITSTSSFSIAFFKASI